MKYFNPALRFAILIIFLSSTGISKYACSQTPDTLVPSHDSTFTGFLPHDFDQFDTLAINKIDTSVAGVQQYDLSLNRNTFRAGTGNQGLASVPLVYSPLLNTGYHFTPDYFAPYHFTEDSVRWFLVHKPYTHVFYVMGSKKEQHLRLEHSQNVASNLNLGLRFNYVNAPGYYQNQEGDDKNFELTSHYHTSNRRYQVFGAYIHNKIKVEENGGMVYDTVFTENTLPDRRGVPVNLNTASNYIKENHFELTQRFRIRKHQTGRDSSATPPVINPGSIAWKVSSNRTAYRYQHETSDNNGFYPFIRDSLHATFDSVNIFRFSNEFSWTNNTFRKGQWAVLRLGLRHNYIKEYIDSLESAFYEIIPNGRLILNFTEHLQASFYGDFVTGNTNPADWQLKGKLNWLSENWSLRYELASVNRAPYRMESFYRSNHFSWENDFDNIYSLVHDINFGFKGLNLQGSYLLTSKPVYFDATGTPVQLQKTVSHITLSAHKNFKLGKWSTNLRLIYQANDRNEILRYPQWSGWVTLAFTSPLFSGASNLHTGFDLFWFTRFKAYSYMPATRVFYSGNGPETGNYPWADFFLNLQIKRARLFVKVTNLYQYSGDYRYIMIPGYPTPDSGFRFGVSWMFYD